MEYKVKLSINAMMLDEAWDGSGELYFNYDFNEDDLKILTKKFSRCKPTQDVSAAMEQYLPHVFEEIYDIASKVAKKNSFFNGKVDTILDYLDKEFGIEPIDVISKDIKSKIYRPINEKWKYLPTEDLRHGWCECRQKDFEHTRYSELSSYFERQYKIYVDFIYEINLKIYLPQEVIDAIKKKKPK